MNSLSITQSSPGAVEVVLTLAAASGDSGGIEPEGRPAVPVTTPLISIITVGQQSTSARHLINISMWKGTYCYTACYTSLTYLYHYYRWPEACLAQRHIIIMYWLRPLVTNVPRQCEAVCGNTLKGFCYHTQGWLTLTCPLASPITTWFTFNKTR